MKISSINSDTMEEQIKALLDEMTLNEKIGQLCLVNSDSGQITPETKEALKNGKIGGVLNEVDLETINKLQKIAVDESRLGIPLLIGRDVIHGFKSVFPVPLGLASTWNEEICQKCGDISSKEASQSGVNWTYAPMVDICRDPRWGRVAESFGEDPYLASQLAIAMIQGFQGDDLSKSGNIAACVKHFAGYGASESGKDYNTTNIPENELRNVHLPPFKAAIDAGAVSIMTSFSDLDGIPASANDFLLKSILRDEWNFDGFVVSDWESISQLKVHGLTASDKESANQAVSAGVDMEMTSHTYSDHLAQLVEEGKVTIDQIDQMVTNILKVKYKLGLFDNPYTFETHKLDFEQIKKELQEAAVQSCVLLKNEKNILPLNKDNLKSIAVIGPLADEPDEQLGTWVFDGNASLSKTPLKALEEYLPKNITVNYVRGLTSSRSNNSEFFDYAIEAAKKSDVVLMFMGEEAILTGEAHCRADISLPGIQKELIQVVSAVGKPVIVVLLTGRPLALENVIDNINGLLCAWHPGTMGGPAIVDLLFGLESPSGKLPITFPRITGQIPIYYAHKNTGRPGTDDSIVYIDDIEIGAPQHSFGNTSFHLDIDNSPLYPFGFGLSYTEFKYSNLSLSKRKVEIGQKLTVKVDVTNTGKVRSLETVQLYLRDLVGSVTRPVKELKKFKKVNIEPGETKNISFELTSLDLSFYGRNNKLVCEPGKYHIWVGGSSDADLKDEFEII